MLARTRTATLEGPDEEAQKLQRGKSIRMSFPLAPCPLSACRTLESCIAIARILDQFPLTAFYSRDGDYANPHTSEESPRIMTRRRGRRARRLAPLRPSSGWWHRRGGANRKQQKRRQAVSDRLLRRCVMVRIAGGRQPCQRQRLQWDVTPSPSPRLKTAHAHEASLACRTSHLHPCIAPITSSRA